jgi:ABC-type nitrate/sulfonate/bicarbonate transport system substrate-binding protein
MYVGVSSVSMGNIIIYVTKEAKLFEKYGLYADPVAMRGSGESSKAMIGGSIQVAPIATPTVINADLSGADLVILSHTLPGVIHAMVVKPEIKRVEDLKGKKSRRYNLWLAYGFSSSPYPPEKGTESRP